MDNLPNEQSITWKKRSLFDVWALGITIVLGGQFFGWNPGLSAGLGSFTIGTFLIASAYSCLILSLAEITSGIPFAGGCYALTRCMIGLYPGFIIGCCEALEYITYVATSTLTFADMIVRLLQLDECMKPVVCVLFYLSAVSIHICGGNAFWRVNYILAIISIFLLLIYCFGVMSVESLDVRNGQSGRAQSDDTNQWFVGGFSQFAQVFPLGTWFYLGVESLGFACYDVDNPKKTIPLGMILCLSTLVVTSILVLFVCSFSRPGLIASSMEEFPLSPGYGKLFQMDDGLGLLLSVPATYATAFGFIYGYGKILHSMAISDLFPKPLTSTFGPHDTPHVALIMGSMIGIIICTVGCFYGNIAEYSFLVCATFSCTTYICQSCSYIVMKLKYSEMDREFTSPLGIYGAIYSGIVFSFGLICCIAFQRVYHQGFIVLTIVFMLSLYYWCYAKQRQSFSDQELKLVFNDMIARCNQRHLNTIKYKRSVRPYIKSQARFFLTRPKVHSDRENSKKESASHPNSLADKNNSWPTTFRAKLEEKLQFNYFKSVTDSLPVARRVLPV